MQKKTSEAHSFFELLFKHRELEQKKIYAPQIRATIQEKDVKEKNATRILVIGDFMAYAAADALKGLYIDNTGVIIINGTVPDSGLVRTDYYSWKRNISKLIDKNKPEAIIIMVGANDNQPITMPHGLLSTEQPEWLNVYERRVTEITKGLRDSGKPWIWVGQPAFENNDLTRKMLIFNELYKNKTEAAGGHFVSVWGGFVDTQGQFSFSGYDVNGIAVKLRTNNGINFTSEGKKKLASYLEKQLKIVFNSPHVSTHLIQSTRELENIKHQPPMSLDEIAQKNTRLLDREDLDFVNKSWPLLNGHHKDRADDFSLP